MKPDDSSIDDVLNQCSENIDSGTLRFHGMSYEQGVQAGIEWVIGFTEDDPMPEK